MTGDEAIKHLNLTIDTHYKNSSRTLEIKTTPREFWELGQAVSIHSHLYSSFWACEKGDLPQMWYRGAKLIRALE